MSRWAGCVRSIRCRRWCRWSGGLRAGSIRFGVRESSGARIRVVRRFLRCGRRRWNVRTSSLPSLLVRWGSHTGWWRVRRLICQRASGLPSFREWTRSRRRKSLMRIIGWHTFSLPCPKSCVLVRLIRRRRAQMCWRDTVHRLASIWQGT